MHKKANKEKQETARFVPSPVLNKRLDKQKMTGVSYVCVARPLSGMRERLRNEKAAGVFQAGTC